MVERFAPRFPDQQVVRANVSELTPPRDRVQAVVLAYEMGLVRPGD